MVNSTHCVNNTLRGVVKGTFPTPPLRQKGEIILQNCHLLIFLVKPNVERQNFSEPHEIRQEENYILIYWLFYKKFNFFKGRFVFSLAAKIKKY